LPFLYQRIDFKKEDDFMWAFLVLHWWLPLLISVIIGVFICFIYDHSPLAQLLVGSFFFTIGLALSGVFYSQRWDIVLSIIPKK